MTTASRTADKFIVRLPEGMRDQLAQASTASHYSMNTFFLQALEEKLARGARIDRLLDLAEKTITEVQGHE